MSGLRQFVGDIGSSLSEMNKAMGDKWAKPPVDWINAIQEHKDVNLSKMASKLMNNQVPMVPQRQFALRTIVKQRPDAILVNEGANTLDFARSIIDVYKPRKRLMWAHGALWVLVWVRPLRPLLSSTSVFLLLRVIVPLVFSWRLSAYRYNLPICIIVFNNNGIYRGTDIGPNWGADVAPTICQDYVMT